MEKIFIKYVKIPYLDEVKEILDNEVEVYEKLDGGNCQIRKIEGRIRCGSRSKFLDERIYVRKGVFTNWFKDFVSWANKNYSLYNLPENFILFGEWLAKHTIEYEKEYMNKFYLIDLFDISKEMYVPYEKAIEIVDQLGIKDINFVECKKKGIVQISDLEKIMERSDYYDGPMEGVVIKDYKNQKFAKYLHPKFSEIREGEKDPIRKYITTTRIDKLFSMLEEEGIFWKRKNINLLKEEILKRLRKNIEEEHGIKIKFSLSDLNGKAKREIEKQLEKYYKKS